MRILVVEDEPNLHRIITKILNNEYPGVEIDVAETGEDALAFYNTSGLYDLVITDYAHPGNVLPGDFVEAMRASNLKQAVILQTGNFGKHIDAFTERWKDIPYLEKPWQVARFRDLVKKMVS